MHALCVTVKGDKARPVSPCGADQTAGTHAKPCEDGEILPLLSPSGRIYEAYYELLHCESKIVKLSIKQKLATFSR